MKPWNLLPMRDRASLLRRWGVGTGLWFSALSGGALVGWVLSAQEAQRAQLQADMAAAQNQWNELQQQTAQLQKEQSQDRQTQARWQHVSALRLRAQRLDALHQVMVRRWPADVQVQELRVDGAGWQLQGPAASGLGVAQLLQALAPYGPWQQAPTLLELAASPGVPGQAGASWRYVVQGRWSEPGLLLPAAAVTSAQSVVPAARTP